MIGPMLGLGSPLIERALRLYTPNSKQETNLCRRVLSPLGNIVVISKSRDMTSLILLAIAIKLR